MKLLLFFIVTLFSSCGIIATAKRDKFIRSKGYDPGKDTSIIKPYEYYIKHKGYVPIFRQINEINRLDIKIGILGYESTDTIPIDNLFKPMTFVLSDNSYKVYSGELRFSRNGISHALQFGKQFSDSCMCKASFDFVKMKFREKKKADILFFWNVSVTKDNVKYLIPSRTYYIK